MESRSKREEPETVYNIEVEGDHVYRAGESGVLVHNASQGEPEPDDADCIPDDILVAFVNATKLGDVCVPRDIEVNDDDNVQPPPEPVTASSRVMGKSLAGDPNKAPLTGWWWWILRSTALPDGIAIIADGTDDRGTHFETHRTLYSTKAMPLADFSVRYLSLGWKKGEEK